MKESKIQKIEIGTLKIPSSRSPKSNSIIPIDFATWNATPNSL